MSISEGFTPIIPAGSGPEIPEKKEPVSTSRTAAASSSGQSAIPDLTVRPDASSIAAKIDYARGRVKDVADKLEGYLGSIPKPGVAIPDSWREVISSLRNPVIKKINLIADGSLRIKVQLESDPKLHVYLHLDGSHGDKVRLIFDKNVNTGIESGAFKSLRSAFTVDEKGKLKSVFSSKDYGLSLLENAYLDQQLNKYGGNIDTLSNHDYKLYTTRLRLFHEQRVAEAKIPGTAKVHSVHCYVGKNDQIKLVKLEKFYSGGTLATNAMDPSFSVNERTFALCTLAEALSALHREGFSHNDLKPDNVMLNKDGESVLIDFGGTTHGGERVMGSRTPEYLPPEMIDRDHIDKFFSLDKRYPEFISRLIELQEEIPDLERRIKVLDELREREVKLRGLRARMSKMKPEQQNMIKEMYKIFLKEKGTALAGGDWNEALTNLKGLLKSRQDEQLSIIESLEEMTEHETRAILSIKSEGFIPQKNDNFALGLIARDLFPGWETDPSHEAIKPVIKGLLEVDPDKRWTSEMAFLELRKLLSQ